ncbi:MAG: replication initiation factor domain-containing protein [Xanthomonadales bacterium]|nr:replication initiation factor domain-containing protein [Xanthomonadales bacterium]
MSDGGFSPERPGKPGDGPGSNTGQKATALVDYLTVVISVTKCEDAGLARLDHLLETLFSFNDTAWATQWQEKRWQFYDHSAVILDREGEMVGRAGRGSNGNTVCISLSGTGCKLVRNWSNVQAQLERLGARISRCDVAWDDYTGETLDVRKLRQLARDRAFMQGGTPPKWRFIDDEGCGTGCTLYVGSKGHKELCVYEKGKQLGFKDSPWVRSEVRLYGKHGEVPLSIVNDPMAFLRGAYDVLADLLLDVAPDACTRIKTERAQVEATGEAMVEYLRRQVGPSLNVLLEAFGGSWVDFMQHRVVREGSPGRFRGVAKGERLYQLLREQLCPAAS